MIEIIVIDGNESIKTWEDAINYSAEMLYKKGFVTEDFAESCIKREKKYPTGLPTEEPVAIPHAEADNVIKNSLSFLRLKHPVDFKRMDDENETVSCRLVINMAISAAGQVTMLQKLMKIVKDKKNALYCIEQSREEVLKYVQFTIKNDNKEE